MDLKRQKAALLALQAEYQQRIAKITDRLRHPQDDLGHRWDDRAADTAYCIARQVDV